MSVPRETFVIRALLEQLAPAVSRGALRPTGPNRWTLMLSRVTEDVRANAARVMLQTAVASSSDDGLALQAVGFPIEMRGAQAWRVSPSGSLLVVMRKDKRGDADARILDVYADSTLVRSIDCTSTHGDFLTDPQFGRLAFSEDESWAVYVAERKRPATKAWWDGDVTLPSGPSGDASSSSTTTTTTSAPGLGSKFEFVDDWGEQYTGVSLPSLFLVHFGSGRVVHIATDVLAEDDASAIALRVAATAAAAAANRPGKISPTEDASAVPTPIPTTAVPPARPASRPVDELAVGQPDIVPGARWVIFTGWTSLPRRLGAVYCVNRPSSIWAVNVASELALASTAAGLTTTSTSSSSSSSSSTASPAAAGRTPLIRLTAAEHWARSARLSPTADRLAYLSNGPVMTHNACAELRVLEAAALMGSLDDSCVAFCRASIAAIGGSCPEPSTPGSMQALLDNMFAAYLLKRLADSGSLPSSSTSTIEGGVPVADDEWTAVLKADPPVPGITDFVRDLTALGATLPPATTTSAPGSAVTPADTARSVVTVTPADRAVVPIISQPAAKGSFPGLFTTMMPDRCWSADGRTLYMDTQWGFSSAVLRIDTVRGIVDRLKFHPTSRTDADPEISDTMLLDVAAGTEPIDAIAVAGTAPNHPSRAAVLVGPRSCGDSAADSEFWQRAWSPVEAASSDESSALLRSSITWRAAVLAEPAKPRFAVGAGRIPENALATDDVSVLLAEMRVDLIQVRPEGGDGPGDVIEALVAYRHEPVPRRRPVVLMVHGGPHSAFTSAMYLSPVLMHSAGYATVLVNYRGSTGYGEAPLRSLPGRVGRQDVDDCMAALNAALAAHRDELDSERVAVMGGSHGGFLSAHLIGQFPDRFRCAVIRNPVTDIAGMNSITDIPDWTVAEALGKSYDLRSPLASAEDLATMREASPARWVSSVRAPVLLGIGSKDRRVPPSNGLAYYHALIAHGVPAKLLVYPDDNHALASTVAFVDFHTHAMLWLSAFLAGDASKLPASV